jgi:hypothetical protein
MGWTEILTEIFKVCIIPLLGVLTGYLVAFIKKKMDAVTKNTESELTKKYLGLLEETVINCVLTTKQTYVDALKNKNAFDADAQKEAFERTYSAVVANLTEESRKYLEQITADLPQFITEMIEARVAQTK